MAIAARESRDPGSPSASGRVPDASAAPGAQDGPLPSMGVARSLAARLLRRGRPKRTVRLRLALFYGGLFFVSGAALLATTYVFVVNSTPSVPIGSVIGAAAVHVPLPGHPGRIDLGVGIQRAID